MLPEWILIIPCFAFSDKIASFSNNAENPTIAFKGVLISCDKFSRKDVFIVDVRGVGAVKPAGFNNAPFYNMYGTMHKLCNDAIMTGSSMMEMQVNDILLSLKLSEKETTVTAYGKAVPSVLVASVFGDEITNVRTVNGIDSFKEIMKCRAPFVPEYEVFGMAKNFDLEEIIVQLKKEGKMK